MFIALLCVFLCAIVSVKSASSTTSSTPAARPTTIAPGSLTCHDVTEIGSAISIPVSRLRGLQPEQAVSCVALLGKDPLSEEQARVIWEGIVKMYELADLIPDETLRLLGWISFGIPSEHFWNISLVEIDTVAAFGVFHNLSLSQLMALGESVRFQWSSKEPEDFTYLDLGALGHILCGLNVSDITRIHSDAYKEAAQSLSLLRGCPIEVLRALAALAVDADAFGDPKTWNPGQIRSIGCVIAGLSNSSLARIPAEAMKGVTPSIAQCLPASIMQILSNDQISKMQAYPAGSETLFRSNQESSQRDLASRKSNGTHHINANVTAVRKIAQERNKNKGNCSTSNMCKDDGIGLFGNNSAVSILRLSQGATAFFGLASCLTHTLNMN